MSISSTGLSDSERGAARTGAKLQREVAIEPLTITVSEARRLSGLGLTSIYKMIGAGELEVVKFGTRTLITYNSLKRRLLQSAA